MVQVSCCSSSHCIHISLPTGKTEGKEKGRIGSVDFNLGNHMSDKRQGFYYQGKCINRYQETNCNFCHPWYFPISNPRTLNITLFCSSIFIFLIKVQLTDIIFQMYNVLIQHLYFLGCDHHNKSSNRL